MSKEKEEVVEKDNVNQKKSNPILVTILIVLLLIVFTGIGYGLGGVKTVEKVTGSSNGTSDSNTVVDDSDDSAAGYVTIDVDVLTENLISRVGLNALQALKTDDFDYSGKKVSDFSDREKGLFAFTYYYNKGLNTGNEFTVSENDVKYAYDSIFGAGSYKSGQDILGVCDGKLKFTYNGDRHNYVSGSPACGGTSTVALYEKIVNIQRSSSELKITTAIAVYNMETSSIYKSVADMKNSNAIDTIENIIGEEYTNSVSYSSDDKIYDYIKNNSDSLQQYTYTFEVDTNGFYKYIGFERTKE